MRNIIERDWCFRFPKEGNIGFVGHVKDGMDVRNGDEQEEE